MRSIMWFFNKKNKNELKRTPSLRSQGAMEKIRHRISPWGIVIGIIFVCITSGVIVIGGQVMPWGIGQKPRQDIRVRAEFQEFDEQATAKAQEQARQSTPNYYLPNKVFLEQVDQDLTLFYNDLKAIKQHSDLPTAKKLVFEKTWHINAQNFNDLRQFISKISPEEFQKSVRKLKTSLAAGNSIEVIPEEYRKANTVVLVNPETKIPRQTDQWIFDTDSEKVNAFLARTIQVLPLGFQPVVERYLKENFKPIWLFDKAATDKQRQTRFDSEANRVFRKFEPGSLLVKQDQEIDKREVQLLEMENKAYWNSINPREKLLAEAGIAMLVVVISVSLWVYCARFQRKAIHNWSRASVLALSLFAMVAMARIMDLGGWNSYGTVFEVVLLAMVMSIAYDHRFALVVMTALVCLLMITLNGNVSLLLTLLAGGATVVLTLEEIRSRSKLIEIASAAALMAFAVVWASQLADYQEVKYILKSAMSAAGGALAAGLVVQGLLPVIERLFQIATSMTLLEWCDASKPLLRKLTLEAPGTFSHSLLIGSLAEAAADAIGANGLLARAGSYYHDIGKINKPKYFVENQPGNVITRHKGLSPAMSMLIIIGHVKDGLELAQEYGLPNVITRFIAEHHGTTLIEYFYNKAVQQPESDKEALDVAFRYPGPKPYSKEIAIVMLADGVESAARSLAEPTMGRIETIVHQIVEKRLEDGQFDNCDITLRELHAVEDSLTKSLSGFYHSRIAYPSQTPSASPDETITSTKVATGI
ncbi:MAG: HDIG domain-containing metalloprotein [Phycisphaerae bacterium]